MAVVLEREPELHRRAETPAPAAATATSAAVAERPLLEIRGLTLQYATADRVVTAAWRLDLDVHAADRFMVLGPSGCGKSSLLKAVAGFLAPAEGSISLGGARVRGPGPDRIVVFQEFDQLLPWKTVADNVAFPLVAARGMGRKAARERARAELARVGLAGFADAYPHTLSGGMKQRAAIARALATEPRILLMDEPFAALDALTRRRMQDELLRLWEELRFTVLFVTHSVEEALLLGSRVVVMSPHPGQVVAELDAAGLDGLRPESPAFQAAAQRIDRLIFGDAAGAARG